MLVIYKRVNDFLSVPKRSATSASKTKYLPPHAPLIDLMVDFDLLQGHLQG